LTKKKRDRSGTDPQNAEPTPIRHFSKRGTDLGQIYKNFAFHIEEESLLQQDKTGKDFYNKKKYGMGFTY